MFKGKLNLQYVPTCTRRDYIIMTSLTWIAVNIPDPVCKCMQIRSFYGLVSVCIVVQHHRPADRRASFMKRVDSVVSVKDSRDGKFLCSHRMREQRQQRQKQEFFPTAQCYITPRPTDDVTYELSKKRQEV